MATVTGGFSQYDLGTNVREDLSNIIYNVDVEEVPFFTGAKKTTATNQNHEWLTDSYDAAATNYKIEGEDSDGRALSARTRLGNRVQISEKVQTVTDLASMVNTAGIDREIAYQIVKAGNELKRDIELMCLTPNAKVTGSESVAAEAGTVGSYVGGDSNITWGGTAGTAPTGDGSDVPVGGTTAAIVEADLEAAVDNIFANSGSVINHTLFANAGNKRTINNFLGVTDQVRYDAGNKAIAAAMDIYVSDYGQIRLQPSAFMTVAQVYVLDMSKFGIATMGGAFRTKELAQGGLYDKVSVHSFWTMEALAPKSSAAIVNLA